MDDLAKQMEAIREEIDTDWSPDRVDDGRVRLAHGIRRQAQIQAAVRTSALVMLLAGAAGLGSLYGEDGPEVAYVIPAAQPNTEFTDGSHGYLLTEDAEVTEVARRDDRLEVRLDRGAAIFSVVRDESRRFQVSAGRARVEVLGTTFRVERGLEEAVEVSVLEGRVRVFWDGEAAGTLTRGQRLSLPPLAPVPMPSPPAEDDTPATAAPEPAPSEPTAEPEARAPRRPSRPQPARPTATPTASENEEAVAEPSPEVEAPSAPSSWQELARDRQYDAAHSALQASGSSAGLSRPQDLMLAADAARLSGHPSEAVGYLQRMVSQHPGDARAALGAFTLGRILLHQLGRPAEAAQAFRRAQALRLPGSMREDALAREVEAWSRAGNTTNAQQAARQYEARYPNGRRLQAVRRHARFE